jgi:hypothetical protein
MAIEAVAAVAAKEVISSTAVEATKQLAEKIAAQATESQGVERTLSMEQMQQMESFKIGENPDAESRRDSEYVATEELKDKIDNFDNFVEISRDDDVVAENETTESYVINRDIITRNESLKGDVHPITGVPFEEKTVIDADGNNVTGVFPEFDSKFDAQLPEDMLQESDSVQFCECNDQLKEAIQNDPELAKEFTPDQLEQIQNGDTPDGCTWHHNEETGKMQIVDSETHARTGHTGGRSIWGGGSEFR